MGKKLNLDVDVTGGVSRFGESERKWARGSAKADYSPDSKTTVSVSHSRNSGSHRYEATQATVSRKVGKNSSVEVSAGKDPTGDNVGITYKKRFK